MPASAVSAVSTMAAEARGSSARVTSLDIVRGVAMILMAMVPSPIPLPNLRIARRGE